MSHIVEFSVVGLAGRKDIYKQKLNRDTNVFFGLNGSGKTSLLRILDSAMTGDATTLTRVPFRSAEVTIHSMKYAKDLVKTISKHNGARQIQQRRSETPGAPVETREFRGQYTAIDR